MMRALLVAPGRGSYAKDELGSIARAVASMADEPKIEAERALAAVEASRRARGLGTLAELDGAQGFSPRAHLAPEAASDLVFAGSAVDLALVRAAEAAGALEVVAVAGNSLGFYTALYASGALGLDDAARVVGTMATLQRKNGQQGGQLIFPVSNDQTWRKDADLDAAVARALLAAAQKGVARRSIRLGGTEVLAGDDAGMAALAAALPALERGGRKFPITLAGHSAFHTPLMERVAAAAREALSGLAWRAPRVPLIDGRGAIHRPRIAAPRDLFDYTLRVQPTETYDFTLSIRVAMREYAPDVILTLGPGDTLGGPIGQTLVAEGWAGIRDREAFRARQATGAPILLSLGRAADRRRIESPSTLLLAERKTA